MPVVLTGPCQLARADSSETRGKGVLPMCFQVTCDKCGKATWSGCGYHVEQALADVVFDERCVCAPEFARS